VRALRVECLADAGAPGAGRAPNGNFVLTGVELETSAGAEPGGTRSVPIAAALADYSQSNGDWRAGGVLDLDRATGWAAGSFEREGNRTLVLLPAQPLELGEGARLRVVLRQESQYAGHNLARVRCSATGDAALAAALAPGSPAGAFLFDAELAASLREPPAERGEAERARLRDVFRRTVSPRGVELARALDAARTELKTLRDGLPTCMVMAELPEPRVTHVFKRGDFRNPGDVVEPGVPEVLGALPAGARGDRLALARWIVSPADPLAARVAVNRAWERLFGTGLVATSDDFGTRGDPPSHPELLDWLAIEFVESGWSTKALLARIVESATYRSPRASRRAWPSAIRGTACSRAVRACASRPSACATSRSRSRACSIRRSAVRASSRRNPRAPGTSSTTAISGRRAPAATAIAAACTRSCGARRLTPPSTSSTRPAASSCARAARARTRRCRRW
jgi:hypothetical protein